MSACNSQLKDDFEQKGQNETVANVKAIYDWEAVFENCYNKQDFAKAASVYGDKGQMYPPGMKPRTGKHEIAGTLKAFYDHGAVKLEVEILEVRAMGENDVLEISRYAFLDANGDKARFGTRMVNWYKVGQNWEIRYDVVQNQCPM